jgi:hypothetical protein
MDLLIVFHAVISAMLFLGLHVFFFRNMKKNNIISVLFSVYLIVVLIHVISAYLIALYLPSIVVETNTMRLIIYPLTSLFMYSLFVFSFILAIFGITITSLRIQILSEIYNRNNYGMTEAEISRKYSNEALVKTRVERLVDSEELVFIKGKYYPRTGLSYFQIHTYALVILNRLYNLKGYRKYF